MELVKYMCEPCSLFALNKIKSAYYYQYYYDYLVSSTQIKGLHCMFVENMFHRSWKRK